MTRAWTWLFVAGALEIVWAVGLKYTHGFSRPGPTAAVLSVMAVSFYCLSQALKGLPMGTAYAVWTGIGAAGTAICGVAFFGEPAGWARIACIAAIVAGTAGLKLFSH